MKKYLLYVSAKMLLIFLLTSCKGQDKTTFPSTNSQPPKLIKTQGSTFGNVGCELQDKAGNLWFSTTGEGVYRYDGKTFANFTVTDGLSHNDVGKIIQDKAGNILFATKLGICKYKPSATLKAGEKPITPFTENDDESKQSIWSLYEDRKGNIWFSTMGKGVYRYDGKTFTNFLYGHFFMDILEDKSGKFWFSSWERAGAWRYDPTAEGEKAFENFLPCGEDTQDSFTHEGKFFSTSKDKKCISDDMIFSITEDKAGNIWFATRRHGASRLDPTRKAGEKPFTNFTDNEGFADKGMYAILEDRNGNMWFTTEADGVWRFDGNFFKNFTTKDGLVNNSVFTILEDKSGNLWFGTREFGLSCYDGKTFTTYSE